MKTQAAINDFLQSCYARNLKPASIEWYRVPLQRFAALYPKLPTKPGPVEAFLAQITGSAETKHARYRALNTFYTFIHQRRRIPNPMEWLQPPRHDDSPPPTLEAQEVWRVVNSATHLRDKVLLNLLIDSAIRAGELANLRVSDIKTDTIEVYGKTQKREVPISEETKRQLLSLAAMDGRDGYVFHGHKGRLSRHGVYRIVSTHMRKASIQGPKLGSHRLRHAFGRNYVLNGGDLRSLQEIMGHRNITTTQRYARLNVKDTIPKHHEFTLLRSAHAAAQGSFFKVQAIEEAEAILSQQTGKE